MMEVLKLAVKASFPAHEVQRSVREMNGRGSM
jgi:hypothetical protein